LQDKEMVERLLQLKAQLDDVLSSAFQASPAFADQLTSAFQSAVNSRSNKPAELVAKFIDAKLRGSKGVGEGELEAALDKALVLFGYIQVCGGVNGRWGVVGC
jgi:cullin-4